MLCVCVCVCVCVCCGVLCCVLLRGNAATYGVGVRATVGTAAAALHSRTGASIGQRAAAS